MTTYLTRTPSSTTDAQRKTWTYSVWVKPSNILSSGDGGEFAWIYQASGGSSAYVRMDSNYKIRYRDYTNGGSPDYLRITDRLFRDPSAWYHVVLRNDTTQSTAADRVRLYVNGELQEWQNANQPAQDHIGFINSTFPVQIGETSSNVLRGSYLSQAIMCAGQSYAPTVFGSTNANGIWIPNSQPSITYGANGFKLDFAGTGASANASGFGADSSGNGNHFTSTGLGTNPSTTDTCQNNFATLNPLSTSSFTSLSKGNVVATGNSADNNGHTLGTIAPSAGKWYWEAKYVTAAGSTAGSYPNIGVYPMKFSRQPLNGPNFAEAGYYSAGCEYRPDGSRFKNNSTSSYGTAWSTGDILGVALDMENYAVYFSRNGTFQDSGNPTSGASKTGAANTWSATDGAFAVSCSSYQNSVMQFNFGNPVFTVASSNADANGYGNFEYAPPSGYYALCTKNLALYGG